MRRTTLAAALTAAALLAAPQAAGAKGYEAASVCGANGCHRVDAAAVRAGFDDFTPFPTPDRPERFFTVHLRARVASGRLAEVGGLDWLAQSGITRGFDEGLWARPGAVLAAALRRAARGLRPRPAAELGAIAGSRPQARVVEVFAPATDDNAGGGTYAIAAAAALIAAAAVAIAAGLRRRRADRPAGTVAAKAP
jgi:hypothetical protein